MVQIHYDCDYVTQLVWELLGIPPGRAVGSVWGKGSLGITAQASTPAT